MSSTHQMTTNIIYRPQPSTNNVLVVPTGHQSNNDFNPNSIPRNVHKGYYSDSPSDTPSASEIDVVPQEQYTERSIDEQLCSRMSSWIILVVSTHLNSKLRFFFLLSCHHGTLTHFVRIISLPRFFRFANRPRQL